MIVFATQSYNQTSRFKRCIYSNAYIKIVLVEKNKTAKWLSEQVGRNVTSVSRWCTNASQPDLETLFRIAELLDVDVRELLHVEKDKSK